MEDWSYNGHISFKLNEVKAHLAPYLNLKRQTDQRQYSCPAQQIVDYFVVANGLLSHSKPNKYGTRIHDPQMFFLYDFPGPSSK